MNYFYYRWYRFHWYPPLQSLHEVHPETKIYNLDIVEPGTPLPTVKKL